MAHQRYPVLFAAHGSPMTALDDDDFTRTLARFGAANTGMRAIVVVSAHWKARAPVRVTSWTAAPLLYDFGGFPDELYRLEYPAPGDPTLAAEMVELLRGSLGVGGAEPEPARGLDHGAWVPLRIAWPAADTPVIQVSQPAGAAPQDIFDLGRALRPLRERGVMLVASGGVVHNLRRLAWHDKCAAPEPWAAEFDNWVLERLAARDWAALLGYRDAAPHAAAAVPTSEHFDPLLFAAGAAFDHESATPIYRGFQHGNLSMLSVAFG